MKVRQIVNDFKVPKKGSAVIEMNIINPVAREDHILLGIKIKTKNLPENTPVELLDKGIILNSVELWVFEGGLIPLKISMSRTEDLQLRINNKTNKDGKISIVVFTDEAGGVI